MHAIHLLVYTSCMDIFNLSKVFITCNFNQIIYTKIQYLLVIIYQGLVLLFCILLGRQQIQLFQAKFVRRKLYSSLYFARIKKCQKRRCRYFSIFCFLSFCDTSKNEQARSFPSFSHGPHSKQKDVNKMVHFLSIKVV